MKSTELKPCSLVGHLVVDPNFSFLFQMTTSGERDSAARGQ